MCAIHSKRFTLPKKDIDLARRIRGDTDRFQRFLTDAEKEEEKAKKKQQWQSWRQKEQQDYSKSNRRCQHKKTWSLSGPTTSSQRNFLGKANHAQLTCQ